MKQVYFLTFLLFVSMALSSPWSRPPDAAFEAESTSLPRMEQKIRDSAVRLWPLSGNGYGSGTYIKFANEHLVLTASHVIGPFNFVMVEDHLDRNLGQVVYRDPDMDIAVVRLAQPMVTRRPMPYQPRTRRLIGVEVCYSGYPNLNNLLSLHGHIAGHAPEGRYFMQSWTWFGGSGAGVFDAQGRLVGVLSAMDAVVKADAQGNLVSLAPLANLVVVTPLHKLGKETLQEALHGDRGMEFSEIDISTFPSQDL